MARKWGKSLFASALQILLAYFDNPVEPGEIPKLFEAKSKNKSAKFLGGFGLTLDGDRPPNHTNPDSSLSGK
jgi:hypothetical protein